MTVTVLPCSRVPKISSPQAALAMPGTVSGSVGAGSVVSSVVSSAVSSVASEVASEVSSGAVSVEAEVAAGSSLAQAAMLRIRSRAVRMQIKRFIVSSYYFPYSAS